MELVQQGKAVCTLRNDDTTAYHVEITGDVNKDINVPELIPGQHVQFDLAPTPTTHSTCSRRAANRVRPGTSPR